MINRQNWQTLKKYLEYRSSVDLLGTGSLRVEGTYLRHVLIWAGEHSFRDAESIRPTLPEYLLSARLDGKHEVLSAHYVGKVLSTARRFFVWLVDHQKGYRTVSAIWVRTLKVRGVIDRRVDDRVVTIDEIRRIAQAPVGSLVEERIRASAVFWYLSGIRIGAFVTLPIAAVDLESTTVKQFPDMGVRTKNKKHALTHLLQIPELLRVVSAWDKVVREVLPGEAYWFAPISPVTGKLIPGAAQIGEHRQDLARKNLAAWLAKVGMPYRSPHKFRHGHIHYAMKRARDIADYKAISMNVMHSSMGITDKIYSRMRDEDIHERISSLGSGKGRDAGPDEEVAELIRDFLAWRERAKDNEKGRIS